MSIIVRQCILGLCLCLPFWTQAAGVEVGQPAPAVQLPNMSGSAVVTLESLRGKVVYVDFWASWCGPCRVSFPILEQLQNELGPAGFEVLAINLDEVEADAIQFLSDVPVSYAVVRDAEGTTPLAFGVKGMPTGYLVDRAGIVRVIHQGFRKSDGEHLRVAINELLGEQ